MRPDRSFLPLFALLVGLAAPLAAQTAAPLRFQQQLVVTPSRTDSSLWSVPAFVTVLDEADIAGSPARDIPDLLRSRAGVHVVDLTGNRRSYRIDTRGFGESASANTLVLVDGRRANQPDLSGTDWALIPLDRVARIEVIRGGAGGVLYGDNATGGVINIVTKDGSQRETRVGLEGGSYGTLTPEVSTRGAAGRLAYSVSGRYNRSDGHRQNAQTEGGDLGGGIDVRVSDLVDLGVSAGYHTDDTGLPGALRESEIAAGIPLDDSAHPDDFADVDDGYVMITPRIALGSTGEVLADVSVRDRDSVFFSSFVGGTFTGGTGVRTVAVSPKIVLRSAPGSAVNQLVAGADFVQAEETIDNTTTFGGVESVGRFTLEKRDRGVYVHDELGLGRLTLTGGYRRDSARYTFAPSDPASRELDEQAGSGGVVFSLGEVTALYGSVTRSFRYPLLDELFNFFGNTIDPNLVPQHSVDVEGGVRFDSGTARASASVFRLVADDEIFFNPVGAAGFGANENLDGESRRAGLELAASATLGTLDLGGTYTLLDTRITGGRYDGERVPGVPRHRATVGARVLLTGQLALGLDAVYTGARRFEGDYDSVFGEQEAYVLLESRITYRPGGLQLFLDLKNLLDEEYAEYGLLAGFPTERAFYPSPGRHAIVGLEVVF